MWLHDLPQDAVLALCTAVSMRWPVLLIGFIEADTLRQLAALPPHRVVVNIPDTWPGDEESPLAQLFQTEAVNSAAPRITLVAPSAPAPLLQALLKLPKGWVASSITQPGTIPDGLIAFNLRTKSFLGFDPKQVESPHVHALVAGSDPARWKLIIQTSLRLASAKAQSLAALVSSSESVEETLRLLGIGSQAELDFCVSLACADYSLDLSTFQQQASIALEQNVEEPGSNEVKHLRERLHQLQRETLHMDDVRAMLNGIVDSLVARGVPPELLTRALKSVLPEWISFSLP
jgi:hypothetical protein